jgi:predicted PhzF superfamily epimerase YddE/YHI9
MKNYRINVFSDSQKFANQCDVYIVSDKFDVEAMLNIAKISGLSESVFLQETPNSFLCRIFSPKQEMTSCTHATLAASFVHSKKLSIKKKPIIFQGKPFTYNVNGNSVVLSIVGLTKSNIDVDLGSKYRYPIFKSAKKWTAQTSSGRKRLMVEFTTLKDVLKITPSSLAEIDKLMPEVESYFIYCSCSNESEFYGRMFAPKLGIDEDPVNGNSCIALFSLQRINKPDVAKITFVQNQGAEFTIEEKRGEIFLSANCFEKG